MEATFRDLITADVDHGRTVLLASHILAEVEALCDRISIVREGRIVENGTMSELRHLKRTSVEAELVGDPNQLAGVAGIHELVAEGNLVRFAVDPDAIDRVLGRLTAIGVRSLTATPPTLEELFLRHYRTESDGR
jgi:ABC-2 type transport system ATP-binding protein